MGAPAGGAGDGKHGGVQLVGDAQHPVDQPGVEVHIGTGGPVAAPFLPQQRGGQPLHRVQQAEFPFKVGALGHAQGVLLEDAAAGVAEGVDRVAHPVDQPRAVAGVLIQHPAQVVLDLVVVVPVVDVGLQVLQLLDHLAGGAAVAGPLQSADAGGDGGVGVGAGGGEHPHGEGGVVAAAVLAVQRQAQVQQPGLLVGELLIRPQQPQDVLGGGVFGIGVVQVHAAPVVHPALDLVGGGHDGGHPGHQPDRLAHDVLQGGVVGGVVIGGEGQHRPGEHGHDVAAGHLHNHVLGEVGGQVPAGGQDIRKAGELGAGGQAAHEQQPDGLLKAEPVLLLAAGDDVPDVDPPVD